MPPGQRSTQRCRCRRAQAEAIVIHVPTVGAKSTAGFAIPCAASREPDIAKPGCTIMLCIAVQKSTPKPAVRDGQWSVLDSDMRIWNPSPAGLEAHQRLIQV